MAYSVVEGFLGGVNRTRPQYAGVQGSLYAGINCHLSRGGDAQKRLAFVEFADAPEDTFGFERAGGKLYVFGSVSPPTMPADLFYQRLQHPDGYAMTELLSTDVFGGRIYAIARFADGAILHFYDGALVTDWTDGVVRASMVDNDGIAEHLKTLLAADTTFNVSRSGNVITIEHTAVDTPFTLTTETVNVDGGTNDQAAVSALVTPASGSDEEVRTITISGTFEPGDRFGVVLAGNNYGAIFKPSAIATVCRTHGRKMYVAGERLVQHSGVDNALLWDRDEDAGAGFFDVSIHESESETVTAISKYLSYLAIASQNAIQIWSVDSDEENNFLVQTIGETGTRSPRAMRNYGTYDTFYLSESGIRSIRPREQVNIAGISDVGTRIDDLVVQHMRTLTDEQVANACSIVEPISGRFWVALGDKIFVFTYFPDNKVSGWTWYEPGVEFTHFVVLDRRIYGRATNGKIYVYGGLDGQTYDSSRVTVQLPFFAAGKAGTHKRLVSASIAAQGSWSVKFLVDPDDLNQYIDYGTLDGFTFNEPPAGVMQGEVTHWAPLLVNEAPGPASVSFIGQFYEGARSPS